MTLVASQVRVAGTGELFLAPVGSTLPTSTTTLATLDAAFKGYGLNSDEGVTITNSVEKDGIPAWQSLTPVRYIFNGREVTIEATFLQANRDTLKLWMGSGDFASDGGSGFRASVPITPTSQQFALILKWDDDTIKNGFVFPKVEVMEVGDVQLNRAGAAVFKVKFSALTPDSGSTLYEFITTDSAFAPPA